MLQSYLDSDIIKIAVITVEPADKISFVYNCMHTRLRGQYNGKCPISLVYVSRPLVTVITAILVIVIFKRKPSHSYSGIRSIERTLSL